MVEYVIENGIIVAVKAPISIDKAMAAINNIGKRIEEINPK